VTNQSRTFQGASILALVYLIILLKVLSFKTNLKESASQETDDIEAAINVSHNEERYDQNIELASDTSQSGLPFPDADGAENSKVIITAPDGTNWLQITPGDLSAGRHTQQNILRSFSGPTPYAKRNVFAGSPTSA